MVKDARSVHHLPAEIAVVHVTHEQGLGGEGVRLDLHVSPSYLVHETGFPDVWEAADEEGPGIRIDRGETGEMLTYLLQILQVLSLLFHYGAHPTQGCPLQLFTAIERVGEFDETNVVFRNVVYEVLGYVELSQGKLVVVSVVEDVHEVSIEGMDVVQLGELGQYGGQLVVVVLLGVFYLSRVELAYP